MRLVIWGLGPHALKRVVPAVLATTGIELYGVCSRNAETVASCVATQGCRGWTNPVQMLADPQVDVVYLATPIGLHAEHGRMSLDAGKHLWCEKPFTATGDTAIELLDRAQRSGLVVAEAMMFLYHPQFEALRRLLVDGTVGKIWSITCRFGIPRLERPGFRTDRQLGGGAFLDIGCYPVAAALALADGDTVALLGSQLSRRSDAVDHSGWAVLKRSNGFVAHLEWAADVAYRNEIHCWGDAGSVSTERIFSKPAEYVPTLCIRDANGRERIEQVAPADQFVTMLEHFRAMAETPGLAAAERRRIADRAAMLDRIKLGPGGA